MKQTLALLFLLTLMVGCKKDKDEPTNSSQYEQLVDGTWYLQSVDGVEVTACEKKNSIKFRTDGSLFGQSYGAGNGSCDDPNFTIDGAYTVEGNQISINLGLVKGEGTYSISNGILSTEITSSGETTATKYDRNPGI